mmetsp:Transcript_12668/g.28126  ORF Transcript_12668/g.28126 Transcript_12668/m.28126 type:complete len:205 (+) Transcript_12668:524-1138(+)
MGSPRPAEPTTLVPKSASFTTEKPSRDRGSLYMCSPRPTCRSTCCPRWRCWLAVRSRQSAVEVKKLSSLTSKWRIESFSLHVYMEKHIWKRYDCTRDRSGTPSCLTTHSRSPPAQNSIRIYWNRSFPRLCPPISFRRLNFLPLPSHTVTGAPSSLWNSECTSTRLGQMLSVSRELHRSDISTSCTTEVLMPLLPRSMISITLSA